MAFDRLLFKGLRHLQVSDWRPSPDINLIVGVNGSGKTSLLEGIYLLAMGRSFRDRTLAHAINFNNDILTLFGHITDSPPLNIGLQRQRHKENVRIKLNGQRLRKLSLLAEQIPIQLINGDTFNLIAGPPKARRAFLDWGAFHANKAFFFSWQHFKKALKQRNFILKYDKISNLSLVSWTQELVSRANQLDTLRTAYVKELQPIFNEILQQLAIPFAVSLDYYRGWDNQRDLATIYRENLLQDQHLGATQAGPQRADLRCQIDKRPAVEVLSRGQQKIVISALKLAQGQLYAAQGRRNCYYLIDDLSAELDRQHQKLFCQILQKQQTQCFITTIETQPLADFFHQAKIFQLIQGQLTALT